MAQINELSRTTDLESADLIPVWKRENGDTRGATLGTLVDYVQENLTGLEGSGTVTSVALSAPTGLSVGGSPVTASGTLALTYTPGYSIPTDALQATWTAKQAALVSGTNIKTVNGQSLLGSGDLTISGGGGGVSSVGVSVPTGLSVSGSPVTSSGTIAISYSAGYSIPTDSAQSNWNTAFGWGNHASAGYLTSSAIGTTVQGYNANTVIDAAYVHTDNNFTSALLSKLNGIAAGATANSSDATLLARANHTGTQTASTISDFNSAARAQVEAELIAGSNITITPAGSGASRTLTIAATTGGSGSTNLSYDAATRVIASDSGTDATLPLVTSSDAGLAPASGGGTTNFLRADGTWAAPSGGGTSDHGALTGLGDDDHTQYHTDARGDARYTPLAHAGSGGAAHANVVAGGAAGFMTGTDKTKLDGIASGATANSSDATLLARANHTGTQLASTISDFASAVAATAAVTANTAKVTNATHTGDVTGATALTIANDVVTNAKLANVATATIKGRATAGTGDPEDLSASQVRTIINVADGATANSSDATLLDRANHTGTQAQSTVVNLVSDLAAKAPLASPTFTGTVTLPAGTVVNGVTLTTAGGTTNFLRADGTYAAPPGGGATNLSYTASTRVIASDTGTDATLPLVTSSEAGLAPASGGGTTNFLRADGTWAAPSGGGGVSDGDKGDITVSSGGTVWTVDSGLDAAKIADGSVSNTEFQYLNGVTSAIQTQIDAKLDEVIATDITATKATPVAADKIVILDSAASDAPKLATLGTIPAAGGANSVQFNNAGFPGGAANVEIEGGNLRLDAVADPSTPAAGGLVLYGSSFAGRMLPKIIGPSGIDTALQVGLHGNAVFLVSPASGTTAPTAIGGTLTTAATMSLQFTAGSTDRWAATARKRFQTTTTAGNNTGMRTAYTQWFRGSAAGFGGFFFRAQFGQQINLNGGQKFVGLCASTAALAATAGSVAALVNMCGMGFDTTDASTGNWFFLRNDGSGTATKVDLGTGAARNTTHGYDLVMFMAPNSGDLFVRITNLNTGTVVLNTSYNTDVPAANTGMAFKAEVNNGAVAAADNLEVAKVYIETDY